MQMTLEADYAVRIVMFLAKSNKRLDAKTIAENTNVTLRFSLKILRKLVGTDIVKSFKGSTGGYELARNPKDITLYSVVETVEGNFAICRCLNPDFVCTHSVHNGIPCKVQKIYDEISNVVKEKLQSVNFAELIDNNSCK
ncbi:MAG: Rrf2 family transcriptional regulator [Oscillospiraceae bacterium]